MSEHLFRWTHVTATYERGTQIANLYINGKLEDTRDVGYITRLETSVLIGSTTSRHFYTGLADEIRLFK